MRRKFKTVIDTVGITHAVFVYPDSHSLGRTPCGMRYVTDRSSASKLAEALKLHDVILVRYQARPVDCVGCIGENE